MVRRPALPRRVRGSPTGRPIPVPVGEFLDDVRHSNGPATAHRPALSATSTRLPVADGETPGRETFHPATKEWHDDDSSASDEPSGAEGPPADDEPAAADGSSADGESVTDESSAGEERLPDVSSATREPPADEESSASTDAAEPAGDGTDRTVAGVSLPDADHFVYVVRCGDGSLYTGYTTDVERRLAEHRVGDGAKYTRGRTPIELVHVEGFASRGAAQSREHAIKALDRSAKVALIE